METVGIALGMKTEFATILTAILKPSGKLENA